MFSVSRYRPKVTRPAGIRKETVAIEQGRKMYLLFFCVCGEGVAGSGVRTANWMPNSSLQKRAGYVNHFTSHESLLLDDRCLMFTV
jgi:hypothetical protein